MSRLLLKLIYKTSVFFVPEEIVKEKKKIVSSLLTMFKKVA